MDSREKIAAMEANPGDMLNIYLGEIDALDDTALWAKVIGAHWSAEEVRKMADRCGQPLDSWLTDVVLSGPWNGAAAEVQRRIVSRLLAICEAGS